MARKTGTNVQDDDELERLTSPDPDRPSPEEVDALIDRLAEYVTAAQIDRLVKLRAQLDRRDGYRAAGVSPRTHLVIISGATHEYGAKHTKDKKTGETIVTKCTPFRRDSHPGDVLLLEHLDEDTVTFLLTHDLAERPV